MGIDGLMFSTFLIGIIAILSLLFTILLSTDYVSTRTIKKYYTYSVDGNGDTRQVSANDSYKLEVTNTGVPPTLDLVYDTYHIAATLHAELNVKIADIKTNTDELVINFEIGKSVKKLLETYDITKMYEVGRGLILRTECPGCAATTEIENNSTELVYKYSISKEYFTLTLDLKKSSRTATETLKQYLDVLINNNNGGEDIGKFVMKLDTYVNFLARFKI